MKNSTNSIEEFLKTPGTLLDVRSPSEFEHARIPGAKSLPVFSDEERAIIGTAYKTMSKEKAIEYGLQFWGPKLNSYVSQTKSYLLQQNTHLAKIHCWRGGMRSSAIAWLLQFSGIPTLLLDGGYKNFRHWVLRHLFFPGQVYVLGGMTGVGKTQILHSLNELGEQILDLESIAKHKGSAFGNLESQVQPGNEQFENELACVLGTINPNKPLWIEDESRMIGTCSLPTPLLQQMRSAPILIIERPLQERSERLIQDYGNADPIDLIGATLRVQKKLGGKTTKEIVHAFQENRVDEGIRRMINYYDSRYAFGIKQRSQKMKYFNAEGLTEYQCAQALLNESMLLTKD